MNKLLFTIIVLVVCMLSAFYNVDKQPFVQNDIPSALKQAKAQQKLLLVQFTARWCAPCQIMEENTWTNPDLIEYMRANCVAGKVDIENLDGMTFTQQYKVKSVPTLILFNARGEELARYENSISASHLKNWIEGYNTRENRLVATQELNATEEPQTTLSAALEAYSLRKAEKASDTWSNGEMALLSGKLHSDPDVMGPARVEPTPQAYVYDVVEELPKFEYSDNVFVSRIISPKVKPIPNAVAQIQPTQTLAPAPKPAEAVATSDLVYTVQVGAFVKRASAEATSKSVSKRKMKQTWVLLPQELHDKYYRVVSGVFYTHEQALAYANTIKADGLQAFVRILPESETLAIGYAE